MGFNIGSNGIDVVVKVTKFYNDFKMGFWSGDAVAEVGFNLTAKTPDGSLVFSRSYDAVGVNGSIMIMTGAAAAPALINALSDAVAQVVKDEDLRQALIMAGTIEEEEEEEEESVPSS